MDLRWGGIRVAGFVLLLVGMAAAAGPFAVFPQAGELVSPDRRLIVRNVDAERPAAEFVGTFHSLWLSDIASGRSRKICDYVGMAAVAWSGNDYVVITQYVSKKSSRALVFPARVEEDPIVLDVSLLARTAPDGLREALEKNDHTFVEASRFENKVLYVRVWGYGKRDPSGFRWNCQLETSSGVVACTDGK